MWDTDVCTNLIEGTPWIKHFAKHSQIGSVHSVMKSLQPPGTWLRLPGGSGRSSAGSARASGRGQGKVETRCLQTQGEGTRARVPGGLPADSSPAGTDFTSRQDLGVLGMAVGSTCLPIWVAAHLWGTMTGRHPLLGSQPQH